MKVKIENIGKVVTGKTPSTSNSANFGEGYSFITPADLHIDDGVVKYTKRTITQKGFNSIKNNTISGLSILVGCIGWDMGNVALVNGKCATNQQINSITDINYELYNPYYIYYWLKLHKNFLFKLANVTRTPILKKSDFENIEIEIPNIKVQNTTAGLLRTIDSKIANNNAISKELESMAKTIYNYWFLQFEFPDKDGKPYKSNGGKMVWNEQLKQEIPEGWEVNTLKEILKENIKSKVKVKEAAEIGKVPFFTSGEAILFVDKPIVSGLNCYLNTGGNAGIKWFYGDASYSTDTWSLTCDSDMKYLLPFILKGIEPSMDKKFFQGTGLKHLQKNLLRNYIITIPDKNTIDRFKKIVNNSFKQQSKLFNENLQLKSMRDFLLPMLMNGQVTIDK
ncbi:restriction endonuclease subunit S [Lactobacillus amylolyticus]|uniref:Type I restriction modification DNA specificity domain protein n=1 Tax=Lactobacillus amylolyticus DSM 11664 TaxID=585524 RepID=D4YVB1_9LACO|nr:restriction endonuclease subunit S [Lactobacillus amylolyticus]EFG54892.1 type I restriction modification DNA specificity domain protein [Lactobacillus amylolyticus DSM 11664]KRL17373.1 type I restriction enzyme S protein [Lactobacillus amylolyticus DSM 11664]QFY04106.1 restriction endonuclease subunit S [Lactobacillus amylolyticus]TDG62360.1 hypothetical protein C5L18_000046 [Lactobacillus amylolyticus]